MNLRDLFNDRKWHTNDLHQLVVVVRHRGAPGDERAVAGSDIVDVTGTGLLVAADADADPPEPVFLPYHRVLRINGPSGSVWIRSGGESEGA